VSPSAPAAPPSDVPGDRPPLALAAGLAVAAFGLYAFTAAPDLPLVDSAELALACATGGVPHPPGVPLYRLLGGVFAKFPVDTPVRAINLMSAFFAALAAGATFLAAERMLVLAAAARRDRLVAAAAAALAFATSWNPWTWSAVAEVYSLNAFLIAAAWACGWAAIRPSAGAGPAIAAVFLAAFGLANHHATAAIAFPVLLLMAWAGRPALLRSPSLLGAAAAAIVLALSLYLTLLPAARIDPGLAWGGTTSVPMLLRHVTGAQYALQVGASTAESMQVVRAFGATLLLGCGIPAALLAAGGLVVTLARRGGARATRLPAVAPVAMIALNLVLSARYIAGPEDRMAYDLPATIAWALLAALGARALLAASRWRAIVVPALLVLPAAWNVVRNLPLCDLRHERCARLLAEDMLGDVPPRSVFVTSEWNLYAPYLYLRHVEGWRTDLRVVDVLMMRRTWYLDYVAREMPDLVAASRPEFDRFRDQIRRFDVGQPYDQANIQSWYDALMTRWVQLGVEAGGAYVDWVTPTLTQEASWIARLRTRPDGMRLEFPAPGESGLPPAPAPRDVANLRYLRGRITAASLDGDRTTLIPRHDPYWKVWSQYQAAVTASLMVALRDGEPAFEARRRELAAWFPDIDRIAARARTLR